MKPECFLISDEAEVDKLKQRASHQHERGKQGARIKLSTLLLQFVECRTARSPLNKTDCRCHLNVICYATRPELLIPNYFPITSFGFIVILLADSTESQPPRSTSIRWESNELCWASSWFLLTYNTIW